MTDLPRLALSVRQPWAWAIIHAGKDVENRSVAALRYMSFAGVDRIAIHASQGMGRREYEESSDFMRTIGVHCPPARELLYGGPIGSVAIAGVVRESASPWFFGPRAILLSDPQPCEFIRARGSLGLFEWRGREIDGERALALWMANGPARSRGPIQGTLL